MEKQQTQKIRNVLTRVQNHRILTWLEDNKQRAREETAEEIAVYLTEELGFKITASNIRHSRSELGIVIRQRRKPDPQIEFGITEREVYDDLVQRIDLIRLELNKQEQFNKETSACIYSLLQHVLAMVHPGHKYEDARTKKLDHTFIWELRQIDHDLQDLYQKALRAKRASSPETLHTTTISKRASRFSDPDSIYAPVEIDER